MITTNFNDLIPQGVVFNLKQIEDMNLIKTDMSKKLIYAGELETVKIGKKLHVSRTELIRYLENNTVPVTQGGVI
jgi:hypothetical protein